MLQLLNILIAPVPLLLMAFLTMGVFRSIGNKFYWLLVLAFYLSASPVTARLITGIYLQQQIDAQLQQRTFQNLILLGGSIQAGGFDQRAQFGPSSDRLLLTAELFEEGIVSTIIVSGGAPLGGEISEAEQEARLLVQLGVDKDALILEKNSENTESNATEVAEIMATNQLGLAANENILVTSLFHMPRARLLFCNAGVRTTPKPAAVPVFHQNGLVQWMLPSAGNLAINATAMNEAAAWFYYRVFRSKRC